MPKRLRLTRRPNLAMSSSSPALAGEAGLDEGMADS